MKKIILTLLACLILCSCGEQQPEEPVITESLVWEEAPQLNHGVLEYEKLTAQPWYCGRLEFTGHAYWAETELGYYCSNSGDPSLYYADKINLSNWVPVCNKPNCVHTRNILGCNSHLGWGPFVIRDGRICYPDMSGGKNEVTYLPDRHGTPIICSRAPNGTDHRIDYYIEAVNFSSAGGASMIFTPEYWLVCASVFNPEGTYTHRIYRATDAGVDIICEHETEGDDTNIQSYLLTEYVLIDGIFREGYQGDRCFTSELISEIRGLPISTFYRFRDGIAEVVDTAGYELTGKYLSGNTLRLFRENDGYYDLDLTTRRETFLAPAMLKDSVCKILLPNCIVEMNKERMMLFDGETWREVEIPAELQGRSIHPVGVASDRVLLTQGGALDGMYLYQIMLTPDQLKLEVCGKVF